MKELVNQLVGEFHDAEYAHAYMESRAVTKIAAQIHALRKDRGWTQKQLAEKAGVAQERVSKIESGDFSSLTMKTLQKFARAFDVNLSVAFAPFSAGIVDIVNLSVDKLLVPCRAKDLAEFSKMKVVSVGGELVPYAPVQSHASVVTRDLPETRVNIVPDYGWTRLGLKQSEERHTC